MISLIHSEISTPAGTLMVLSSTTTLYLCSFQGSKSYAKHCKRISQETGASFSNGSTPISNQLQEQVNEYFNGTRSTFSIPLKIVGTAFQQTVWHNLTTIPYGTTISYQDLASRSNHAPAHRAAALANGANRFALIIPCHRVVRKDGSLSGYDGGINRKALLIKHEQQLIG